MNRERDDREQANHLYWHTDESVARIAERLDVSRRGLYEALDPIGAGAPCPTCGAQLTYTTRSARQQGDAVCEQCGVREYVAPSAGHALEEPTDPPTETHTPRREPQDKALTIMRGGDRSPDLRDEDLRHRAVMLSGAAIACVALGTVATWLALRDR